MCACRGITSSKQATLFVWDRIINAKIQRVKQTRRVSATSQTSSVFTLVLWIWPQIATQTPFCCIGGSSWMRPTRANILWRIRASCFFSTASSSLALSIEF